MRNIGIALVALAVLLAAVSFRMHRRALREFDEGNEGSAFVTQEGSIWVVGLAGIFGLAAIPFFD